MYKVTAFATPSLLSFETADRLCRLVSEYDADIEFEGFTGYMTVTADPPAQFAVLDILEDAGAELKDIACDDRRSFTSFFGKKTELTYENASIYCTMCREGRVW